MAVIAYYWRQFSWKSFSYLKSWSKGSTATRRELSEMFSAVHSPVHNVSQNKSLSTHFYSFTESEYMLLHNHQYLQILHSAERYISVTVESDTVNK